MKIGVLCVTFNRRALLEKLLANYASQEDSIDTVLVVDNLSTDGTAEITARAAHSTRQSEDAAMGSASRQPARRTGVSGRRGRVLTWGN